MSGLALVLHLDGRSATSADLAPMLAELARRGPDGEGKAIDGPAALGLRLLATTPEAKVEALPHLHSETGCLITGDIRLDNRSELLAAFGLAESERVIGDGALTLLAWLNWGEDCATRLLGDFAFAIWDPRKQQVFAARDQMGMRQLIYAHRPSRIFACASSARAVVRAPGVEPALNELRLAQALVGYEGGSPTPTMYQGVLRLPPAHCLTVDRDGLRVRCYWAATPPEPLQLNSDDAYAEAFREVLGQAIRARLRGVDCVGAMLSGGMDSGSVVAMARRMTGTPLPTFSSLGPDPAVCPETRAIHAALTMPNLQPTLIDHGHLKPWSADLIQAWKHLEEPYDFYMSQPRSAYLAAKRSGVKVVLDGVAGDVLLGHGSQMSRHIRSGHWFRAAKDSKRLAQFWGMGPGYAAKELMLSARGAYVPDWLRGLRQTWRWNHLPKLPPDSTVEPGFAERVGLVESMQYEWLADRPRRMTFAEERLWSWPLSGLTVGRERYDRVAAHFGIETRDPFMDRRLQTFCLSLPMDQFQKDGWPKVILRRAMAGLMPDSVRWRHSKEHLGATFTVRILGHWPGWREPIAAAQGALAGRVRPDLLKESTWTPHLAGDMPFSVSTTLASAMFSNFRVT